MYDRVNSWGGAERVLLALHEVWPEAPLYTAVYDNKCAPWADIFTVRTTWLQKIPFAKHNHQLLSLITPYAFKRFDFSEYDIVLSITSAEAKSITTKKTTKHICYCLTPTRYLWSQKREYERQGVLGLILKLTGPLSRIQDFNAASKVGTYLTISSYIKNQVQKYYHRESKVVYPPANTALQSSFRPPYQNYYLVVSRLVAYKRVDIAINACKSLGRQLVIVGTGKEEEKLKRLACNMVHFVGHLTEEELSGYYMHCRALLFPGTEDFGIVPVEAQSYGKPVIAYGRGGVLDTVVHGKTGIFFDEQNPSSLKNAMQEFEGMHFDKHACETQAAQFRKEDFKTHIRQVVGM